MIWPGERELGVERCSARGRGEGWMGPQRRTCPACQEPLAQSHDRRKVQAFLTGDPNAAFPHSKRLQLGKVSKFETTSVRKS